MNWFVQSVSTHPVSWLLGAIYALSAMVGALPPPGSGQPFSDLFYRWFFDTVHTMLNQVEKVVASRYPQAAANLGIKTTASVAVVETQTQPVPLAVKQEK